MSGHNACSSIKHQKGAQNATRGAPFMKTVIAIESAGLARLPKITKKLSHADAELGMRLLETLDEHDDVPKVYTDFEPSDDDSGS